MTSRPTKKDFSTGGIIWDQEQNRVLMIRVENLDGLVVWTFPKGHPEEGETETQAAQREVVEETGWACSVLKPFQDVYYQYEHEGILYDKTVRWFLMTPEKKTGEFDPVEVKEVRWATLPEARKLVAYKTDKILVSRLEEELQIS